MVHDGYIVVRKRTKTKTKRFTVTIERTSYERVLALARGHRPPLPLRYVVQYAVDLLLERARDADFAARLGDPTTGRDGDD
jgi:hypothetical protein